MPKMQIPNEGKNAVIFIDKAFDEPLEFTMYGKFYSMKDEIRMYHIQEKIKLLKPQGFNTYQFYVGSTNEFSQLWNKIPETGIDLLQVYAHGDPYKMYFGKNKERIGMIEIEALSNKNIKHIFLNSCQTGNPTAPGNIASILAKKPNIGSVEAPAQMVYLSYEGTAFDPLIEYVSPPKGVVVPTGFVIYKIVNSKLAVFDSSSKRFFNLPVLE